MQQKKKLHHSKFKNPGILFELLIKQLTTDILSGNSVSKAKDILFKYFSEKTELGKERKLYNEIINSQFDSEIKAERFLNVILEQRKKLDQKKILKEKYELIKELKQTYDPLEIWLKTPVKNYKIYASVYKIFENESTLDSVKFAVDEIFSARNSLVEHLTSSNRVKYINPEISEKSELLELYNQQPPEIRMLAYDILVEKINMKYSDLIQEQKDILRRYILSNVNSKDYILFLNEHFKKVKDFFTNFISKLDNKNDVLKIKLEEVVNQINKNIPLNIVSDKKVVVLMMLYELKKELEKNIL